MDKKSVSSLWSVCFIIIISERKYKKLFGQKSTQPFKEPETWLKNNNLTLHFSTEKYYLIFRLIFLKHALSILNLLYMDIWAILLWQKTFIETANFSNIKKYVDRLYTGWIYEVTGKLSEIPFTSFVAFLYWVHLSVAIHGTIFPLELSSALPCACFLSHI